MLNIVEQKEPSLLEETWSEAHNTENLIINTEQSSKTGTEKREACISSQKLPLPSTPAPSQAPRFGKRPHSMTQPQKRANVVASKCSFCATAREEGSRSQALLRKMKAENRRAFDQLKEKHRLEIGKREDEITKLLGEISDIKAEYKKMVGLFEWSKRVYTSLEKDKNELNKKYERKLILQSEMTKLLGKFA